MKGEIEGKKVIRMQNYEETSILRIEELIAIDHEKYGLGRRSPDAYDDVRKSAIKAEIETVDLGMLNAESIKLEVTLRYLDRFLVSIMEKRRKTEGDAYCEDIGDFGEALYHSKRSYKPIIQLYLLLLFGNEDRIRLVPEWFLNEENLFEDAVAEIEMVKPYLPARPDPPAGFLYLHPHMNYQRNEVLMAIRRAVDRLNPVVLPILEALYMLGKCLAKPDNYIKTRTGQQVITEKPLRTVADRRSCRLRGTTSGILQSSCFFCSRVSG